MVKMVKITPIGDSLKSMFDVNLNLAKQHIEYLVKLMCLIDELNSTEFGVALQSETVSMDDDTIVTVFTQSVKIDDGMGNISTVLIKNLPAEIVFKLLIALEMEIHKTNQRPDLEER